MSLLKSSGASNYVGVHDLAGATHWYMQKLGLRKIRVELDDPKECVALGFSKDEYAFTLGPRNRPGDETNPLLYTSNAKKAREHLNALGIPVGEMQRDRTNTYFFEMRDLEGNVIEISEEP